MPGFCDDDFIQGGDSSCPFLGRKILQKCISLKGLAVELVRELKEGAGSR